MVWRIEDPQGNEAGKIKYEIVQYTRGAVLDLGCGPSKAFPHFVGVDNGIDTELFGVAMKPDITVKDCSDLADFETGACDAVFSSHLLEHIADTETALREWWRVLKVGGYLILYLPHRDLYPNIGTFGSNPDHKHDFVPDDILDRMVHVAADSDTACDVIVNETRDQDREYSFLLVMQKLAAEDAVEYVGDKPWHVRQSTNPKLEKTACVVRYGGFGDMLQAANILPELKRQGYHVTFMTTPKGQEILKHDPHIDAWFIQDENQVPNHELSAFWKVQSTKFDKFVQLSESVEGTLLALPGRANHTWPDTVRRVELNRNYLEWTSALAELDYHSEAKFYPSTDEQVWAGMYLNALRHRLEPGLPVGVIPKTRYFILWALAGSSIHKFYPWQDSVIAKILTDIPEAVVILAGDYACQILELGWEQEPRVIRESGNLSIRQTLTLAQAVNCVVGPETGVLNAVAFQEDVAKVVLLSHSSPENLTKHWKSCHELEPENTPCYPCHRLHYTRDWCPEHKETGAAICQINIAPSRVLGAIEAEYQEWKS